MVIQMRPRSQRRTTELRGVRITLFLFGVLMPRGGSSIRSQDLHGSCVFHLLRIES